MGFGSMIQGGLDLIGTRMTNTSNARMAREQQAFQQHMSDTAHERETYDLKRAGLNRILSISKGGPGASTPPGARAEMQNPLSSATRAYRESEQNREMVNLTREQARKARFEGDTAENEAYISDFERRVVEYQRHIGGLHQLKPPPGPIGGVEAAARERYEASRSAATAAQLEREIDEGAGEFYRNLRRLGVTGSTATEIFKLFSGGQRRQYATPPRQRR